MKILVLTTAAGIAFYGDSYSPALIQEILTRTPDWQKLELVEMPEEVYYAIPATSEAAQLFKEPPR